MTRSSGFIDDLQRFHEEITADIPDDANISLYRLLIVDRSLEGGKSLVDNRASLRESECYQFAELRQRWVRKDLTRVARGIETDIDFHARARVADPFLLARSRPGRFGGPIDRGQTLGALASHSFVASYKEIFNMQYRHERMTRFYSWCVYLFLYV